MSIIAAHSDVDRVKTLLDEYVGAVEALQAAVWDMTAEQLHAKPQPEKWSSLEVVCHIVDIDLLTADRINRIIISEEPLLPSPAPEQLKGSPCVNGRQVAEEIAFLRAIRTHTARVLHSLPLGGLDRIGVIPRPDGDRKRTIEQIVRGITGHVTHHVRFLDEKRRLLGLPDAQRSGAR